MSPTRYRWLGIALPCIVALCLSLTLILVARAQVDAPQPPPISAIRYVSVAGNDSGNDCANSVSPCATLQHAVDVALAGDEVRAAAGTYAGTQLVNRTLYGDVYSYTQVLYINKSLTVRGGYAAGNWSASDPEANPTIIDAQRSGRGVTIIDTGYDPVTFEGFTVTGGDYTGLGNPPNVTNFHCASRGADCGGGILVAYSAADLRHLVVLDNNGGTNFSTGGGIYFDNARVVTIEDSLVISNSALTGGGMFVHNQGSPFTIRRSVFQENNAYGDGGAISFSSGADDLVTIEQTEVLSNTAYDDGDGAGLYIRLTDNGLLLEMNRVKLQNNLGAGRGKALYLDAAGPYTPTARIDNLLLTGNGYTAGAPTADQDALINVGPGFTNLNIYFAHVTAAGNDVGGFLYAEPDDKGGDLVQVVLANTLLVGFENAFMASEDAPGEVTIEHINTLFDDVANQHLNLGGSPTFTATNPISGNALLDGTYHLQSGSEAIDAGIDAGVVDDIDGDFRPIGNGPDIGVDEFISVPPEAFGKSSPADGAVDQSRAPELTWTASVAAEGYEFCVDRTDNDTCDGSWVAAGNNTSFSLNGLLHNKEYFWQVRAVNGLGMEEANDGTWWTFTTANAPYSVFIPMILRN